MIVITSRGRATKQVTLPQLQEVWDDTVLLVPKEEMGAYARYHSQVQVVGHPAKGLSATRQLALHQFPGKLILMDDDLRFANRRTDEPTKFTPASCVDVREMIQAVYELLDAYAHAGVGPRQGGNRNLDLTLYNRRAMYVLAYDTKRAIAAGVDFSRLPIRSDFDSTLTLLRAGHPNALVNQWVVDAGPSNAPGGCSAYRTDELLETNAHELAALHAPFVHVVLKDNKAWKGLGNKTRTEVKVFWKKAFASSQE